VQTSVAPAHLYLVAHQDDDLLFMNPDVEDSIRKGQRVRTVFLTAAGSIPGQPPSAWQARENAVFNVYPAMAHVARDWSCTTHTFLTNKVVRICTLNPNPLVSVLFMRLQDGSLASLWARDGGPPFYSPQAASLTSVDNASTYTRAELIATLAAIIADFAPDRVGIQDATLAYGPDHSDHFASALFSLEADHTYVPPHQVRVYRDYSVYVPWTNIPSPEVPNLSQVQHDEKKAMMESYGGTVPLDSDWDKWCWRGMRSSAWWGSTGQLMGPDGVPRRGHQLRERHARGRGSVLGASTQWTSALMATSSSKGPPRYKSRNSAGWVRCRPPADRARAGLTLLSNGQLLGRRAPASRSAPTGPLEATRAGRHVHGQVRPLASQRRVRRWATRRSVRLPTLPGAPLTPGASGRR
jgi:LmbE family N-acetylglucosaminyl deacetylase